MPKQKRKKFPCHEYPPDDGCFFRIWKTTFVCDELGCTYAARSMGAPRCPIQRKEMRSLGWRGKLRKKGKRKGS